MVCFAPSCTDVSLSLLFFFSRSFWQTHNTLIRRREGMISNLSPLSCVSLLSRYFVLRPATVEFHEPDVELSSAPATMPLSLGWVSDSLHTPRRNHVAFSLSFHESEANIELWVLAAKSRSEARQ